MAWELISQSNTAHRIGVNTHFGQNGSTQTDPEGAVQELHALGFKFFRDNLNWSTFEVEKGVHTCKPDGDFRSQNLFRAFAEAKDLGIDAMVICAYDNGNYAQLPEADWREAFVTAYITVLKDYIAAGYDPSRLVFEFWNEPTGNISPRFQPDEKAPYCYAAMRELYQQVRAISPRTLVVGPAMDTSAWEGHKEWNLAFCEPGWATNCSGYSWHSYWSGQTPENRTPEKLFKEALKWHTNSLTPAMHIGGYDQLDIHLSEWGYDTNTFGDELIVKYLPRALALYSTLPQLRTQCLYEFIDSGDPNSMWGIETFLWHRKPQADACADVLSFLQEAQARRAYEAGQSPGRFCVLLDGASSQYLLTWDQEGVSDITFTINAAAAGSLWVHEVGTNEVIDVPLVEGRNVVSVTLRETLQLLSADVALSFEDFT